MNFALGMRQLYGRGRRRLLILDKQFIIKSKPQLPQCHYSSQRLWIGGVGGGSGDAES